MTVSRRILMKHQMHKAKDLYFNLEADFINRKVLISTDWLDTGLLLSFITMQIVRILNDELSKVNKLPLIANLDTFKIELVIDKSARFNVKYERSEVNSNEDTLVMDLIH